MCFCSCFNYCHGFIVIWTNPYMPLSLSLITDLVSLWTNQIHICFLFRFDHCKASFLYELSLGPVWTYCYSLVLIYFLIHLSSVPDFQHCFGFVYIYYSIHALTPVFSLWYFFLICFDLSELWHRFPVVSWFHFHIY